MDSLNIPQTNQTPLIIFDTVKGEISISGKSYPENVYDIYKGLLSSVETYCIKPNKVTIVNFNWLYYNTATSKIIIKILLMLNKSNTNLEVNWYYQKGFSMMEEKATTIRDIMKIKINLIETL